MAFYFFQIWFGQSGSYNYRLRRAVLVRRNERLRDFDCIRKLERLLSRGLLLRCASSFLSPLWVFPALTIFRRAALREARRLIWAGFPW